MSAISNQPSAQHQGTITGYLQMLVSAIVPRLLFTSFAES
jgi:hypothetical protein